MPTNSRADVTDDNSRHDFIETWGDCRAWIDWQYKERKIVEALDRGAVAAFVNMTRDVLWQERASLYVKRSGLWSAVSLSEKDERPMRTKVSMPGPPILPSPRSKSRTQQPKSRRRNAPPYPTLSHALTRDAKGKSGEYALYSKQELTDGRRVLKFRGQPLDEFSFYRLSGPKPQPTSLPFDSTRCPEMFDWCNDGVPKGLVEHWRGNPKSSPYGPVARLKAHVLAAL